MEQYPSLEACTRVFSVTGSEYCSESVDTVMYQWSYKEFIALETFVHFQDDRKLWNDRQRELDSKKKG